MLGGLPGLLQRSVPGAVRGRVRGSGRAVPEGNLLCKQRTVLSRHRAMRRGHAAGGGDALPERSACRSLLPEEMLIVSPSASASGAGSRSCLLMLPGRWGSLPLREKTLNPIDYAEESRPVFPTEQENVIWECIWEARENAAPAFPRSVQGRFCQDSRDEPPPAPQLWGSSRCCAHVRTESLSRGRRRQSTAATGRESCRGTPGGTCRVGGKVRERPSESLEAHLRQA